MEAPLIRRVTAVVSCVVAAVHLACANYYSVNFPNSDDYSAILQPVALGIQGGTPASVLEGIFTPHTQHLQVLLRLGAWLNYLVGGEINFRVLILFGSLWIFPLAIYLAHLKKLPAWMLAGSAFLICQPQYSEATQWATNAVPFLWINALAVSTFFALETGYIGISILCSALAVLAWGNGLLVPILAIVLAGSRGSNLRVIGAHCAVAATGIAMYYGCGGAAHHQNGETVSITQTLEYLIQVTGSAFGYFSRLGSTIAGVTVLLFAIGALARRVYLQEGSLVPVFMIVFLVGSLTACAVFRAAEGSETAYTTSRYTLVSALLILFTAIEWSDFLEKRRFASGALFALTLVFFIHSYISNFAFYALRRDVINESILRWKMFQEVAFREDFRQYDQILKASLELGLLRPQALEQAIVQSDLSLPADSPLGTPLPTEIEREFVLKNDKFFFVSGYAFRRGDLTWDPNVFLVIKSSDVRESYRCRVRNRPDVALRHKARPGQGNFFLKTGFTCAIPKTLKEQAKTFLVIENHGLTSYVPIVEET